MRAEHFTGYKGLKLVDLPKPAVSDGKVLLRVTAAGVTHLDHTILSGHFPLSKPPLVLGNEGAGVVDASTLESKIKKFQDRATLDSVGPTHFVGITSPVLER
jgi:NADPH:quinone reductase-like Zn-dependent oxidoreductase